MKIYMKLLVCTFVVSVLLGMVPFESTCSELQRDVLRLHILANSDSDSDQQMKLRVRDEVIRTISPLYSDVKSKSEAIAITKDNMKLITDTAQSVVDSFGSEYEISARITNMYFDTRYYDDFTMPAGMYDTLQITIGEAKGKNWWCVMYPTLCVGASTKQSVRESLTADEYSVICADDFEFRFKIVEYFEKISSYFR